MAGAQEHGYARSIEFWTRALQELATRKVSRFANISPSKDHWLNSATGVSNCSYTLNFLKRGARVELYLRRPEKEENKWIFDQLIQQKETLERSFGSELKWQRLDDKIASRISLSNSFDGYNRDIWPEMIDWLCKHIVRLERAFSEALAELNQQLRSGIDSTAREANEKSQTN